MPTDIKKNLLGNVNVRTMKKDIQRLREVDTIVESRKIFTAKPTTEAPIPVPSPKPVAPAVIKESALNLEKASQYANEIEKQRIFSWQSDKKNLELQLQDITAKKQELDSQKSVFLAQQKEQEAKLAPFTQKAINANEVDRDAIEKQTWPIQQEIHSITVKLDTANQESEKLTEQEKILLGKVSEIESSLSEMYASILKRGLQEKNAIPTPITPAPQPITPTKEKAYVQEISPAFKEKLQTADIIDQARKKSFMEEVESWSAPQK